MFSKKSELKEIKIKQIFEEQFAKYDKSIEKIRDSSIPVTEHDKLIHHQLAQFIAQALLTEGLFINHGIIAFLKNWLQNYKETGRFISEIIETVESNPEIQLLLSNEVSPSSQKSPSAHIIRHTLKLSEDERVTKEHSKQVILSALLTKPRQYGVGSCFATSLAITLHANNLKLMLKDLQELINNKGLTRNLQKKNIFFPFLTDWNKKEETENEAPLLLCWEHSIANMDKSQIDLLKKIHLDEIKTIYESLIKTFDKIHLTNPHQSWIKKLDELFHKKLTYFFDPNLQSEQMSADEKSSKGAWVLYENDDSGKAKKEFRIDSPQKMEAWLFRIMDQFKAELSKDEAQAFQSCIDYFKQDNHLMISLLQSITRSTNENFEVLIRASKKVRSTPWCIFAGGSLKSTLQNYFENKVAPVELHIAPRSAEQACEYILELMKFMPEPIKKNKHILLTLPSHALSLIPNHPSIQKTQEQGGIEYLRQQGENIEQQSLSEKLIRKCNLVLKSFMSAEEFAKLDPIFKNMVDQKYTVGAFFEELPHIISSIRGTTSNLDTILLDVDISVASQFKDMRTLAHFADTNWEKSGNVHFAFAYSPVLKRIALYGVNAHNIAQLKDENQWIRGGAWNILLADLHA